MPYIRDVQRRRELATNGSAPQNVGELTYVLYRYGLVLLGLGGEVSEGAEAQIYRYVTQYLAECRLSFQTFAEIMGALTATQFELERRHGHGDEAHKVSTAFFRVGLKMYRVLAAPYEDLKIVENGDIFVEDVGADDIHVAAIALAEDAALAGEKSSEDYEPQPNAQIEGVRDATFPGQEVDEGAVGTIGPEGRSDR